MRMICICISVILISKCLLMGGIGLKRVILLIFIGLLLIPLVFIFISGCNNEVKTTADIKERIVVAVSIIPQKAFVEAVCGDLVDVVAMIPPGNSPHNYEPTPREIQKFNQASIYFAIGVPTEEGNIIPNAKEIKSLKIVKLHEDVAKIYPEIKDGSEGRDPHIWLSPKRVKIMVESIAHEMSELDPENKIIYEENAKAYIEKLSNLDLKIKVVLENVENRKIIVFHPAFGYLAEDYGIQMYALEEEGKEATIQHMFDMIDLAKKENIKVIFYQAEDAGRQAQSFAEEIGGKTILLDPLAVDYLGNLSDMVATMAEVMK